MRFNPLNWIINRRSQKVAFEILPMGVTDGQPVYPDHKYKTRVVEGYFKNEVIFSCIEYLTKSLAQVDIDVKNQNGDVLDNHPLKRLLLKPSPFTSQYDLLIMIVIDLMLSGEAYFEKVRSGSGQVVQLWRLRPDFIRPVPTKDKFISHYEYDNNTGHKVILPEEDVVRFYKFNPIDPYRGLATIMPASRVGDVDNATVDYIKKLFDSGGIPAGFLKLEVPVDDAMAKEYQQKWTQRYGGQKGWHKIAVLGRGADYKQLGLNFDELAMKDIDAKTITRICMVFGVNPILIGILLKSTFDNFKTAEQHFWSQTLVPLMKQIKFTLNNQLVLGEFSNVTLDWDLAGVKALQADQDKLYERANSTLTSGAITVNEHRDMIGRPPVKGGDIFLRSPNVVEVNATVAKTKSQVKALPMQTKADPVDPHDKKDRDERKNITIDIVEKFLKGQQRRILATVEKKDSPLVLSLKDAEISTDDLPTVKNVLILGSKKLEEMFDYEHANEQDIRILAAYKQADLDDFWQNEDDLFYLAMFPALLESAQVSVENTIVAFEAQYRIGIDIELANGASAEWAKKYSAQLVKNINKTTRKATTKAIVGWLENDLPRQSLIDELTPLFGKVRATTIARTETTRAFFEGNRATWKASGIVKQWRWRANASACEVFCLPLDLTLHDIDSAFSPPDPHPNCECWTEAVVEVAGVEV